MTIEEFEKLKIGDTVTYKAFSNWDKKNGRIPTGKIVYIHPEGRKVVVLNDLDYLEIWDYVFMKN